MNPFAVVLVELMESHFSWGKNSCDIFILGLPLIAIGVPLADDEKDQITCAVCGHKNPPGTSFCEECGVKLEAKKPAAEDEEIDKLLGELVEIEAPAEAEEETLDIDKEIVDELLDSLLIEEEGELFECPVCSQMIPIESTVCPHCGTEFAQLLEKPKVKAAPLVEEALPAEEEAELKVEVSEVMPKFRALSGRLIDFIVFGTIAVMVAIFLVFRMWDWGTYSQGITPLLVFLAVALAGTLAGFVFFKISTSAMAQGDRLVKSGNYAEAIEYYNRAIRVGSKPATAWTSKGVAFKRMKRYEEALRCHEIALGLDDKNEIAWTNKGDVLFRLNRLEEAVQAFDKALEIRPRYAIAWNNKGATLAKIGRFEEAKECHSEAIKIRPRYTAAWLNRGEVLVRLGDREGAAKCLQRAKALGA